MKNGISEKQMKLEIKMNVASMALQSISYIWDRDSRGSSSCEIVGALKRFLIDIFKVDEEMGILAENLCIDTENLLTCFEKNKPGYETWLKST